VDIMKNPQSPYFHLVTRSPDLHVLTIEVPTVLDAVCVTKELRARHLCSISIQTMLQHVGTLIRTISMGSEKLQRHLDEYSVILESCCPNHSPTNDYRVVLLTGRPTLGFSRFAGSVLTRKVPKHR
jgi:hypothetical protein